MNPLTPGGRSSEWKAVFLAVGLVVATGFDTSVFHLDPELVKWVLGPIMLYIANRMYVKGEHQKAGRPIPAPSGDQRTPAA